MVKSVGAIALFGLIASACLAPIAAPSLSPSESPSAQTTATPFGVWIVYYARDLADPLARSIIGPPPAATATMRLRQRFELLAAASGSEAGGAFNTLASMRARLASVTVLADLATLDYSVPHDDWGVDGSTTLRAFVQQVIYTATEEPGIVRVLLTQNGGRQAIIGGEGLVISEPQTRAGISHHTGLVPLEAARLIRMTTTGAHPLLMLTWIPGDWTADVHADVNAFTVTFRDLGRTKTVTLAIAAANLPLVGSEAMQTAPDFHGDPTSLYQVANGSDPRSARWLMWTEPGSWSESLLAGIPYVLSATGLTDLEFWRAADSLHPNQI